MAHTLKDRLKNITERATSLPALVGFVVLISIGVVLPHDLTVQGLRDYFVLRS